MAKARAVYGVVILNLALFIGVTTSKAFQAIHHHWIFPVLGVLLAAEWALAAAEPLKAKAVDYRVVRAAVLWTLAFLLVMGIVRHETIRACVGRCTYKLALAASLAAGVFFLQARRRDAGFWDAKTALRAALASGAYAVFFAAISRRP